MENITIPKELAEDIIIFINNATRKQDVIDNKGLVNKLMLILNQQPIVKTTLKTTI